jgi:subtilisin family serine protease
MKKTILAALAASFLLAGAANAQTLKRVDKADDLPRFSYPVQGQVEAIVRDPQRFAAFAQQRRKDVEGVLATYEITEKAAHRQLLSELVTFDMLEGRWDDALKHSAQIKELQEQPAAKLLSGLTTRAIVGAVKKTGARSGDAFNAEVARAMAAELDALPYLTIRNEIQQGKAGMQTLSESLVLGRVRNVLQPVADKAGALSSDMAPALGSVRYSLDFTLPLKATYAQVYTAYLKAHQVDKPDIWKARDVALPEGRSFATIPVVVWDSGVDTTLFKGRELMQGEAPAQIAFDLRSMPSKLPLKPIPDELKAKVDTLVNYSKGLSDLRSDIDSPEADAVKKLLSTLPPDQYKKTIEELRLTSIYEHGTHVAGIAMAGNPYARVGNARIEFGHTLLPDPCPTPELQERAAKAFQSYVDFMKSVGTRVVNMSWGGDLRSYEVELEQCGIGKDNAERKKVAREYFDMHLKALTQAMASAPDILFVTAAGNSADDPTFNDAYPSGIVLPNLVSVGAVDKAGDEASFTSYGKTVLLHANGYQVESYVPGGRRIAFSGTSMASPQVTNLAAKMLAVKPTLKPAEVIDIMRKTADRSEDGRRTLINPKKALEAVGFTS